MSRSIKLQFPSENIWFELSGSPSSDPDQDFDDVLLYAQKYLNTDYVNYEKTEDGYIFEVYRCTLDKPCLNLEEAEENNHWQCIIIYSEPSFIPILLRSYHVSNLKIIPSKVLKLETNLYSLAAYYNRKDALEWFMKLPLLSSQTENSKVCYYFAKFNNHEAIKWAYSQSFPLPANLCDEMAANNNIEMIEWCLERGVGLTSETMGSASANGHLETVKWLFNHECPFDKYALSNAIDAPDNLACFNWLLEHDYPISSELFVQAAASGRLDLIKRLNPTQITDPRVIIEAAINNDIETMEYAQLKGCPIGSLALTKALSLGNKEAAAWLRSRGCPEPIMSKKTKSYKRNKRIRAYLREISL